MEETPTTSNAMVLLSGVKMTLNKVAVKLELSWQGLRDFDSIRFMADVREERARKVVKTIGNALDDHDGRMVRALYDETEASYHCL